MLSAVIFDLDGVLADSEPWWNQIDAKLLAEYGVKYCGEYHQNVVGVSYRLAVEFYKKAFGLSVPTEEMMRRRGEIATEFFVNRVGLFPHVKEVLGELRQMKLHLAVATSSVSASARPFLDRHQLTGFFEVIVTGEGVERGKPAPDIYLCAAEQLGIPANACLVVEDALPGVAAFDPNFEAPRAWRASLGAARSGSSGGHSLALRELRPHRSGRCTGSCRPASP